MERELEKMIILASSSPRRKALLGRLIDRFYIYPVNVDESHRKGESPSQHVRRLARCKAFRAREEGMNGIIIAADTVVAIDGMILGKPENTDEARWMIKKLGGRTHSVFTGICIYDTHTDKIFVKDTESRVTMKELTPQEIEEYMATGEPLDKAGGYAVQGEARVFVEEVEGSWTNVVGLPLETLEEGLTLMGLSTRRSRD